MAQLKCKACGYIIDEKKLGDVCPACGVPRKAFEPWTDDMSPRRRVLLTLNLHPIALHFPQAFSAMIPVYYTGRSVVAAPFRLRGVAGRGGCFRSWYSLLQLRLFPAA